MFVPIPACPDPTGGTFDAMSAQKINTTLSYGGVACTVATVSALTGLNIPFAAKITFDGVIEMSNAIGGVPVCVAEKIEDTHTELYLDAGNHVLQGVDALKFLRTRYGVGDGSDLTRISSQQVFLSSLVRQVKDSSTLTDITKLYGLAGAAVRNMQFSESLNNVDTLVQIAKAMAPIDLSKITFVQYPTTPTEGGVRPNRAAADVLFAAIAADQSIALTPTDSGNEVGSVADPNAPVVAAPVPVPDPSATNVPATTDPTTVLPSGVLGQTAADYTCSVGRTLDNQ
jgi:LCP family protein required for cell wall assembly